MFDFNPMELIAGAWNIGTDIYDRATGQDSASLAKQNMQMQKDISEKNLAFSQQQAKWQKQIDKRNFDYASQQTQIERQRADTAHQREVADLRAAGLSPLSNLAGSATGNVVAQASGVSPVVPQQDGTGMANAMATAIQNKTAMAGLRQSFLTDLLKINSTEKLQEKKLQHESIIVEFEAKSKLEQIREQLKGNKEMQESGFAHDIEMWTKQQETIMTEFTNRLTELNIKHDKESAFETAKALRESTGGNVEIINNKSSEWIAKHNESVAIAYDKLILELSPFMEIKSSAEGEGQSSSTSFGAETSVGEDFTKVGMAGNGSTSQSTNWGKSRSNNFTMYAREKIKDFWQTHTLYVRGWK